MPRIHFPTSASSQRRHSSTGLARRVDPSLLRSWLAGLGVVTLSLVSGCDITGPTEAIPAEAVRMSPPESYREWYAATEACSGRSGNFDRVEWFVVPGARTFQTEQGEKIALWIRHGERRHIVVAEDWMNDPFVVQHEVLHDLLNVGGHPQEYFVERCQLTWESRQGGPSQAVHVAGRDAHF